MRCPPTCSMRHHALHCKLARPQPEHWQPLEAALAGSVPGVLETTQLQTQPEGLRPLAESKSGMPACAGGRAVCDEPAHPQPGAPAAA